MDHERFGAVTRALASAPTRRTMLKGLVGVAGGGLGALLRRGAEAAHRCRGLRHHCRLDDDCCSGACDGRTHRCACPDGQIDCGGDCATLGTDANGRGCGDACPGFDTCGGGGQPGICGCTPGTCAELGVTCGDIPDGCGGTLHCGDCPAGLACRHGTCGCLPGRTFCDGACVDPATNGANCGGCGNACPSGATCQGGSCVCDATGQSPCGTGAAAACCAADQTCTAATGTCESSAGCGSQGAACSSDGDCCDGGTCFGPRGLSLCLFPCEDGGTCPNGGECHRVNGGDICLQCQSPFVVDGPDPWDCYCPEGQKVRPAPSICVPCLYPKEVDFDCDCVCPSGTFCDPGQVLNRTPASASKGRR